MNIPQYVIDNIRFARSMERLQAALLSVGPLKESLARLEDLAPDLLPELTAARVSLNETVDALDRCMTFLSAQIAVQDAKNIAGEA